MLGVSILLCCVCCLNQGRRTHLLNMPHVFMRKIKSFSFSLFEYQGKLSLSLITAMHMPPPQNLLFSNCRHAIHHSPSCFGSCCLILKGKLYGVISLTKIQSSLWLLPVSDDRHLAHLMEDASPTDIPSHAQ